MCLCAAFSQTWLILTGTVEHLAHYQNYSYLIPHMESLIFIKKTQILLLKPARSECHGPNDGNAKNCALQLQLSSLLGPAFSEAPSVLAILIKTKQVDINHILERRSGGSLGEHGGLLLPPVHKDYCLSSLTCPAPERDFESCGELPALPNGRQVSKARDSQSSWCGVTSVRAYMMRGYYRKFCVMTAPRLHLRWMCANIFPSL